MGLDTAETCRGWRNILRISCASNWFFFTRLYQNERSTKYKIHYGHFHWMLLLMKSILLTTKTYHIDLKLKTQFWHIMYMIFTVLSLSILLTYLLTQWCRFLLEKLTGSQLVKNFPAFHGTRKFITALTNVRHFPILGQPNTVHITTSHLLEIHPYITHPSTPRSPQWSPSLRFPHQNPTHPPLLAHTRHMPSPSHSSRFYHPHKIFSITVNRLKVDSLFC